MLWEGGIRARVMPETKAQTLTVLLQVYSYLAMTTAAMATYAYDQIDQARTELEHPSWMPLGAEAHGEG